MVNDLPIGGSKFENTYHQFVTISKKGPQKIKKRRPPNVTPRSLRAQFTREEAANQSQCKLQR